MAVASFSSQWPAGFSGAGWVCGICSGEERVITVFEFLEMVCSVEASYRWRSVIAGYLSLVIFKDALKGAETCQNIVCGLPD